MSKSLAAVAKIFSGTNNWLYDRYINFRLTRDEPDIFGKIVISLADDDFEIRTPETGIKPDITITGDTILENAVQQITLTVQNMSANIDTMAYNFLTVEAGYLASGVKTQFMGQITNCYMAKPNPNGELVVSATLATVTGLYAQGDIAVAFTEDKLRTAELVATCLTAIIAAHPEMAKSLDILWLNAKIPPKWATQEFDVGKATRYFKSAFECISWLNSLFASYVRDTGYGKGAGGLGSVPELTPQQKQELGPLRLAFDLQGKIKYVGDFSAVNPDGLKTLSCIGSAVLTSTDSATITAPFNPGIAPGDVVYIDSKYFKTRLNIQAIRQDYAQLGNLWYVLDNSFTFSTRTTNMMTLRLVNINAKVEANNG